MSEKLSVRIKALQEKVKSYEQDGEDVKGILFSLGYENSSIDPPDKEKLASDDPSPEIFQLRVDHHDLKREKIMKKVLRFVKEKRKLAKRVERKPSSHNQSFFEFGNKKESFEAQNKRRVQANDRALKLHLESKMRLLQRLKEKEVKSLEHKNKTIALIKEKIEKFQEKEQKKYFSAKQHSIVRDSQDIRERSKVERHRELSLQTPSFEKPARFPERSVNFCEDLEIVNEKLQKFEEKMVRASERHNKVIFDRVKQNERRSQSVAKARSDLEKRHKTEDQEKMEFLMKLDKNMKKTRRLREKNLNEKALNKNKSFTMKISKHAEANADEKGNDLEAQIKQKDIKTQEKLESLRSQFELSVSLKREKFKLNLSDIIEKRDIMSKVRFKAKTKILEKHQNTSKLIETRKIHMNKYEQETREKEFQLSQSHVQHKTKFNKKIKCLELKNSFLITSQL